MSLSANAGERGLLCLMVKWRPAESVARSSLPPSSADRRNREASRRRNSRALLGVAVYQSQAERRVLRTSRPPCQLPLTLAGFSFSGAAWLTRSEGGPHSPFYRNSAKRRLCRDCAMTRGLALNSPHRRYGARWGMPPVDAVLIAAVRSPAGAQSPGRNRGKVIRRGRSKCR